MAFQLTPISAELKTSGPGSSTVFELENKTETPVPIEVSVLNRSQDLDGKDIPDLSATAEEKFVVYPPQFILEAKSTRSVKLTWVGGSGIQSEQAFRVNFQELSLPLKKPDAKVTKPEARISLLFSYSASVYVEPANVAPKLVLASAGPSGKDPNRLEIVIENQGTAHQIIKGFKVKLSSADKHQAQISDGDVEGTFQKNFLARSKIRVTVPWPKNLPKGKLSGEFVPKL